MGCGISRSVSTVSYAHIPPSKRSDSSSSCTTKGTTSNTSSSKQIQDGSTQGGNNLNNNTNTTKDQEKPKVTVKSDKVPHSGTKTRDYIDIYREKTEGSTWSLEEEEELVYETKSSADTRSIVTSRTLLTLAQSAASRRTKSTYLDRELSHTLYDLTYDGATFTSPTQVEEESVPHQEVVPLLPVRPLAVYDGNHFWWPNKRVLLPDYRRVCELDSVALNVPMMPEASQIVQQLQTYCEEEVEVARALYTWLIGNIKHKQDMATTFGDSPQPLKILKMAAGNSYGLSALYKYMCELAGLECEIVRGIAKCGQYYPDCSTEENMCGLKTKQAYAWNKVRLAGRWYLVDVSGSGQACSLEKHQNSAECLEAGFLPKPHDFLPTHLPMYELEYQLEVDLENQLVGDHVIVDLPTWEQQVTRTTVAHEWGIKPLSHQNGLIETEENEVWIQFMCPNIMEYHVCVSNAEKGDKHEGFTLIYLQEDIVTAYTRFPGPGRYVVKIHSFPTYIKPGAKGMGCKLVMMYTVNATGAMVHQPFSQSMDGLWGLTPLLYDTGCRVLSTKGAEITAVGGSACIDIKLPTASLCPNKIWFCKAREEDVNLAGCVYPEREARLARLHLICPEKAEYILECQFPIETNETFRYNNGGESGQEEEEEDVVFAYARFFITCTGSSTKLNAFPCFPPTLSGPQVALAKYNLSLPNLQGSTLYPTDGACQFVLHQERPVEVSHFIEAEDGVVPRDAFRWTYAERNGYDVTYYIKTPQAGRYKLTLTCREEGAGTKEDICVFMIDSPDGYNGDLYPSHCAVWGVTNTFHQLGLCSDWEELAKVEVDNGQAFLMIRAPPNISICPRLYHGNDNKMDLTEYRIACLRGNEVSFSMVLPFKGFYKLELVHEDNVVARYLLHCVKPAKPLVPYEPFSSAYGIHPAFSSHGLKEVDGKEEDPIRTTTEGKCVITHTVPKGLHVRFLLVQNDIIEKGCVYAELNSNEVTYYMVVQDKGYHRFTCWLLHDDEEEVEEGEVEEEEDGEDTLLFSYLIYNPDGIISSETYPEWPQIWGLNQQGLKYGLKIRGRQSSTIKATKGAASLALSHPEDLIVLYSLEGIDLDPREANRSFFLELQSETQRLVSISLPGAGKFAFKIWARTPEETHCVAVGAFLVVANEAGTSRYPSYNDFHPNCRLIEPKINPLSSDNEYFFKLEVPGVHRVQLWDGIGKWTALLETQEEGSDIISGMVNVGGPKELWVAGLYDPDHPHGNGGFRNLLMYEVV